MISVESDYFLGPMLIVIAVTMDLGHLVLLLRMLYCISSRLMCISTVQALQAAVHEHGSDNILNLYVAKMDVVRRNEDTWYGFGIRYDSSRWADVRVTSLGLDSPPRQNTP